MKVGDELVIELDANATTGYEWQIQTPTDDTVIELASSEYLAPDESAGMGAGGTQVFTFRATGVGTTDILIYYWRPWESSIPTEENTYTLNVTVIE
jgi:predicted secreted protein